MKKNHKVNKITTKDTHLNIPNNLRLLVFGGALNSNCYRDKLLSYLKSKEEFLTIIPDKINYFDIASEKYNLIEKETRLFENSDILIIIPESAGSFAEIGMIASMISNHSNKKDKQKYAKKILIVLNKTFKHDESFLKLGPIKSIKELGGQAINVDWDSTNYNKIINRFTLNNQRRNLESIVKNTHELFFANCIKILLHIYINKVLSFLESEYKVLFIESLKYLHNSISIDNIEYLESTELITKENLDGKIIIHVNHKHSFMKDLINKNFTFFMKNKIIKNFLQESGY